MIHADRLIVLHSTRTGEKSLVLHCLSQKFGRRSFIVSIGPKTPALLFMPFSLIAAELVENPRSELWRLRNISLEVPLSGIRNSPSKNVITLFLSEVLFRTVRDEAADAGLFEWCTREILTLDSLEGHFANFHLRFLLDFCSVLGFSPSVESVAPFAGPHLADISALLGGDAASSLLVPLRGEDRSAIAESLIRYLEYHCECTLRIRSLSVLRSLG